jgi:hypothetical protein
MKQFMFLLLIFFLVFVACKESDNEGFSLNPVEGKGMEIIEAILYEQGGTWNGSLGGRLGANNKCRLSGNRPTEKSKFIAFISTGPIHKIVDLPKNNFFPGEIPIKSKNGQIVASNWSDIVDGDINDTLFNLGVLPGGQYFWTGGFLGDDTIGNKTCSGFIDGTVGSSGSQGSADLATAGWEKAMELTCDTTVRLLCLAY